MISIEVRRATNGTISIIPIEKRRAIEERKAKCSSNNLHRGKKIKCNSNCFLRRKKSKTYWSL